MALDLKIGDIVAVKRIGNEARNRTWKELFLLASVSKIGKKYFELKDFYRERFKIENGMHDDKGWVSNYVVYKSMEDALEDDRIQKAKQTISRFNFSAMNAREIDEVLGVIEKYENRTQIHT